jgi:hypothetical protein
MRALNDEEIAAGLRWVEKNSSSNLKIEACSSAPFFKKHDVPDVNSF